jgi:hypothetical protein
MREEKDVADFDMELTKKQAEAYRLASRLKRRDIITEHCKLTGVPRNTAVQRFKRATRAKHGFSLDAPPSSRGAPVKYHGVHRQLLGELYDLAGGVAAERLQPCLDEYLGQMAAAGRLAPYAPDVVAAVRAMPVISVKRQLKALGLGRKRRKLPGLSDVAKQVPVQAHFGQFAGRLGYVALDYVEHNGGDSSGRFVQSGCYVDIATQWVVRAAGWGKNLAAVEAIHDTALTRLHHHVQHFHTDNAPAAMRLLFERLQEPQAHYGLSRSRPYQKNDNAHVEQKNGDKIRKLVGYWRLDGQAACDLLNELYAVEDLICNYFVASAKLAGKEYDGQGKVERKHYDKPKTPYARLLAHPDVSTKTKRLVIAQKQRLNLVDLRQRSMALQLQLAQHFGRLR